MRSTSQACSRNAPERCRTGHVVDRGQLAGVVAGDRVGDRSEVGLGQRGRAQRRMDQRQQRRRGAAVQPEASTAPSPSTTAVNGPMGVSTVDQIMVSSGRSGAFLVERHGVEAARGSGSGRRGAGLPWSPVSLTLGIVGLPNVGKSTLFNALTRNDVLAANYPFATIEPNVGRGAAARPAAARAGRDVLLGQGGAGHGVVRGHRGHREGRLRGRRAGQQVPGQHPRVGRDLPGRARVRRPRRGARRGPHRRRRRHRDDLHRADPGRPADAGEGGPAAGQGSPDAEGPPPGAGGRRGRGGHPGQRPHAVLRRASTGPRCASCRC